MGVEVRACKLMVEVVCGKVIIAIVSDSAWCTALDAVEMVLATSTSVTVP